MIFFPDTTSRELWSFCVNIRDYWMISRGPGFLADVIFGSSTTPSPPPPSCHCQASCHSFSVFLCVVGRAYLTGGGGGWGGRGANSYESLVLYKAFKLSGWYSLLDEDAHGGAGRDRRHLQSRWRQGDVQVRLFSSQFCRQSSFLWKKEIGQYQFIINLTLLDT